MSETVFEAINITKKYRSTLVLDQVSMTVKRGDIYGFIGERSVGLSHAMEQYGHSFLTNENICLRKPHVLLDEFLLRAHYGDY